MKSNSMVLNIFLIRTFLKNETMRLYTAQYRYSGDDRLNITIKGKDPVLKVLGEDFVSKKTQEDD